HHSKIGRGSVARDQGADKATLGHPAAHARIGPKATDRGRFRAFIARPCRRHPCSFQASHAQSARPMISSLSCAGSQGSSSVNIVTHCFHVVGMRVMSVPHVEISLINCISESQNTLHTRDSTPCWRIVFSTFRECMSFYTARVKSRPHGILRPCPLCLRMCCKTRLLLAIGFGGEFWPCPCPALPMREYGLNAS